MSAPQTNGVPPPSSASQTITNNTGSQPSQSQTAVQPSQPSQQQLPVPQQHHHQPQSPSASAPRPRDARTIELLLTAQGVTSYEQRVPLLLLDFAYRHTSSVLSDALHLSADPYTSHAGARPSAASGAAPVNVGDANITANAIQLAIASRLGYQFRGGGAGGGGGISKEWMLETARERNKVALPRVQPSEWGVRLPSERFVLNGLSWGLRDVWAGQEGEGDSESEEDGADAMEGVETEDVTGDGVEGGTMGDVFGDDGLEDEEMVEV
ncbi:transcription initiation factor IID, 31kD subunit-domain-containing protein [Podospora aff. communis PSN243]|uniref:Transcription initiation factor IID, 31kD subunit-domain-containing protein n=1 Tax=Podospora aff. communis PSN243 TaxID=3040156 RepID=A0AAV9H5J6_9PEZI|nr:transcription initiation factor IID, 31kD subunit-domain-containing protein [Podospora aff. communis PSN243]